MMCGLCNPEGSRSQLSNVNKLAEEYEGNKRNYSCCEKPAPHTQGRMTVVLGPPKKHVFFSFFLEKTTDHGFFVHHRGTFWHLQKHKFFFRFFFFIFRLELHQARGKKTLVYFSCSAIFFNSRQKMKKKT
jgi:hypothetical protein